MKTYEEVAATPLPQGYEKYQMYLRRWLLDLRSRVKQLPLERQRSLEARVREFYPNGGKPGRGTRATNAYLLANAGR